MDFFAGVCACLRFASKSMTLPLIDWLGSSSFVGHANIVAGEPGGGFFIQVPGGVLHGKLKTF